jgi:hypothetical protein
MNIRENNINKCKSIINKYFLKRNKKLFYQIKILLILTFIFLDDLNLINYLYK